MQRVYNTVFSNLTRHILLKMFPLQSFQMKISFLAANPLVFNVFALLRPGKSKILQKFRTSREKTQIPRKRSVCRAHEKLRGQLKVKK